MKMLRVHDDFKTMLEDAKKNIEKILNRNLSMEEFTSILTGQSNGSKIMSLNFPFILLVPERILAGRGRPKPFLKKYVNLRTPITLDDQPK